MDKVEMAGSLVAQCWSTFIDESEKIVKVVKDNADFLASNTLEILNNLFSEKRNNRKTYHEEHARVCGELHKLQEGVAKTRTEYEKCLEAHSQAKARFEEQKSKGSKRVDEFKDRYQKSCKKLHVIHNVRHSTICNMYNLFNFIEMSAMYCLINFFLLQDYVLLLCEAAEFERDM